MSERYVQPVSQQLVEKKEKSKYVYKPKEKVWSPDIDYSKSLEAIQAQKTPAALYRHKLETVGRHARDMQRLEWRWSHDIALWVGYDHIIMLFAAIVATDMYVRALIYRRIVRLL